MADVKTASGDITADDVDGLRAKTASGDIEVGAVGGDLRMHGASGDLRCVRVDGQASVTTASGDVEIGSATDRIDLRGSSGDVRLGDVSGDLSVVAVSGDVTVFSLARGTARLRSVFGEVDVGIARGVALSVDAESMSGTPCTPTSRSTMPRWARAEIQRWTSPSGACRATFWSSGERRPSPAERCRGDRVPRRVVVRVVRNLVPLGIRPPASPEPRRRDAA
jgi:hypothetical protein